MRSLPLSSDINEVFYQALFDLANDGISLIQGERFLLCNHRLLEMIGRNIEQVIDHSPWDISPPRQPDGQDSRSKALEYIRRGYSGEHQVFDWVHTRGDGSTIDIEVSLALITDLKEPALLCHWRDISRRKQAENALLKSESLYRSIVEDQTDFIVRWLPDGTRTFVSDSYCRYFAATKEELLGSSFFPLISPEYLDYIREKIKSITPSHPVAQDKHLVITPSGESRWHYWIDRGFFDEEGNIIELQSVGRDIHDHKMAQAAINASEEKFSKAFRCSPEAMMITRIADGKIIEANDGFERNFGYSIDEAIGRTSTELDLWVDPEQRSMLVEVLQKNGSVHDVGVDVRIKSGEIRQCIFSAETIQIDNETCIVSNARDVTDTNNALAALKHQALHDSLTGLPNRNWLKTRLENLLKHKKSASGGFALILLDLDRFKETNNTLGHYTGDKLLKQIGPRLQPLMEYVNGELMRLGGDEFLILLNGVGDREDVSAIATDVLKALEQPFYIEGMRLEFSASLGISIYPENGKTSESLLRCADVAMYQAKENTGGFAFYQAEKDRHSPRRLALMSELRSAITDNQLCLHYQPKIDLHKQSLNGFEALVRWQHPVHGLIPPVQFVPFAEMGESIRPLTYWVIEEAIKQCAGLHARGIKTNMAVNLSTRNLLDTGCKDWLERLLNRYKFEPSFLELEITESALINDPDRAVENLRLIQSTGVQLSIDDFGTGYSSMSYLKRMPIHSLKIDMSFVRQMLESEQDAVIVKSTTNLAHNLGLSVVAEGVEDNETLEKLHEIGCDKAQGYFIGKPMPIDQVLEWVEDSPWGSE